MVKANWFSQRVLSWYDKAGRKDLPWQHPASPYRVWVSEIMLQQTQVKTVIPYFLAFMARFPTVVALAKATVDDVLSHWAGLGYYARGRNLHRAAGDVINLYQGHIPSDLDDLIALPGIGRSTAGAVRSLGYDLPATILDGNVKRVLCRYHAIETWPGAKDTLNQLWSLAESHTPKKRFRDYTQAMMDLGATLCTRREPNCMQCPIQTHCQAFQQGTPTAYPKTKARAPLPIKTTQFLCLINHKQEVLLEKRPSYGIWGGLWAFPEATLDEDVAQACQTRWGASLKSAENLSTRRHTFTHFHLDFETTIVQIAKSSNKLVNSNVAWYKLSPNLKVGLPKPIAQIWSELCQKT